MEYQKKIFDAPEISYRRGNRFGGLGKVYG